MAVQSIEVMLIEDNPGDARLIREMLADAIGTRFDLVHVEQLCQGLAYIADETAAGKMTPDVVLLDLSLPDSQGLDTLAHFRAHAPRLPVIVLTGLKDEQVALSAVQQGAQDYLVKGQVGGNALTRAIRYAIERKQAEEALRALSVRHEAILAAIPDIILEVDNNRVYTWANAAGNAFFGEDVIGKEAAYYFEGEQDTYDLVQPLFNGQEEHVIYVESWQRRKDGEKRLLAWWCQRLKDEKGNVTGALSTAHDITDQKHGEEALFEERNLLRMLMDNLPDAIYFKDAESRFIRTNPGLARHGGLSDPAQVIGKTDFDFFTKEHAQQARADEQAIMETGEPIVGKDEKETWSDGRVRWVSTTKMPLRNQEGRIVGTFGISHDITERKQAEGALRQSEIRYRSLFENMLEGYAYCQMLFDHDEPQDFVYLDVNRSFEELTGLQGVVGRKVSEVIPGIRESNPDLFTIYGRVALTGRPERFETYVQSLGIWLSIAAYSPRREHFVAVFDNITERKRAEEGSKRQLQRMSALHDIDIAITGATDVRIVLGTVLKHAVSQLGVDAATVLLLDANTQMLEFAVGRGFHTSALQNTHLRMGNGYAGQAALESRILQVPNLIEAPDGLTQSPLLAAEGFVFYCAAPLKSKGHAVGVLEVFHRTPLHPDQEWLGFLETLSTQAAIAVDSAQLFDRLQRSTQDLTLAYDATIAGWSRALDLRDKQTEGHTQRVAEMTVRLARGMGVDDAALVHMWRGGLLHDMGKIGIPDSILLKPGQLSDDEWTIMRQHPQIAYDMLSPIAYLRPALDIPYYHHEMWDGTGYPRGLKGEQIPLAARVFAVVDVFDALTSDRPYRAAWPREKSLQHVREQAGKQFDPQVVAAFLNLPGESRV